ncbi:MAG: helix-turn-helix transcriptional regulator [Candidatus Glassbacteria bacterium]
MTRQELAARVKQMRRLRSWSQSHLAEAAGIDLRTVQRLERGGNCSPETLLTVASAFDVDVLEFTAVLYGSTESVPEEQTGRSEMKRWQFPETAGRKVLLAGAVYLCILFGFCVYTGFAWSELYQNRPPSRTLTSMSEDELIEVFDAKYRQSYEDYHSFFRPFLLGLGLYLGIWSAVFGLWRRHWLWGLGALAAGGILTVVPLSLLPRMYFPLDQYPLAALWVIGNAFTIGASWLLVTVIGRLLLADREASPA